MGAGLIEEATDEAETLPRVGQEEMVSGPCDRPQSHMRVPVREVSDLGEGGDGVLLAVDQQDGDGGHGRQHSIHLVRKQAVFQRGGERFEGELVAVDQDRPRKTEHAAQGQFQAATLHLCERLLQRVLIEETTVMHRSAPEDLVRARGVGEAREAEEDHALQVVTVPGRIFEGDQAAERVRDDDERALCQSAAFDEAPDAVAEQIHRVFDMWLGRQSEPREIGKNQAVVRGEIANLAIPVTTGPGDPMQKEQGRVVALAPLDEVQILK